LKQKPTLRLKWNRNAVETQRDNSFPFEQYERELAAEEESQEPLLQHEISTSSINPQNNATTTRRDQLRLFLENDSKLDRGQANNHYFTYRKARVMDVKNSLVYLVDRGLRGC
jgi:hypothetical protein